MLQQNNTKISKFSRSRKTRSQQMFKQNQKTFPSFEDEKENTPESITLKEKEQKEIDNLSRDTEDETPVTAKVGDN